MAAARDPAQMERPRYAETACSQCGRGFGPGDGGFSHCHQHPGFVRDMTLRRARLMQIVADLGALGEEIDPRWSDPQDIAKILTRKIIALRGLAVDFRGGHRNG